MYVFLVAAGRPQSIPGSWDDVESCERAAREIIATIRPLSYTGSAYLCLDAKSGKRLAGEAMQRINR